MVTLRLADTESPMELQTRTTGHLCGFCTPSSFELRGATQAYINVYENPRGLRRLMDFGVGLNVWWKQMERATTLPRNASVFRDDKFANLSYGAGQVVGSAHDADRKRRGTVR